MYFTRKQNIITLKSRPFSIILIIILFFFCSFLSYSQDDYEVRNVRFFGNQAFSKEELMTNLNVYEVSFIQRLTKKKEPYLYNREFADNDKERLIRFYQSEGYIYVNAKTDTINTDSKKRTVDIRFDIREGEPVLVDSISIQVTDNDSINDNLLTRRFAGRFALKKKRPFRDVAMNEDMIRINKAFQNRGYAYSVTSYSLDIDTAESTVNVHYQTITNPRAVFGETTVTGHKYISERLIRRQFGYKPGERYNASKLDKLRQNLYDLQIFRIISVVPRMNPDKKSEPIPVDIILEEMPRIATEYGIGYGTEDKFRAFVNLTYRGIFNDATRLNLYFKHSALEPYHVSLKLIQPQFLDKKTSIMINPYFRRQIEPGFDTQTLGINIPVNRKFNDKFNMALTYYYDQVTYKTNDSEELPDIRNGAYLYDKSGLQYSVSYNNTYPRISPEKGYVASFFFKYNGFIFPGNFNYTRYWLDLRKYQQIKGYTLALRGMIGGIYTPDSIAFIPPEDRFYSGGSNSVRGWGRSQLGPKRESNTPTGGNSIIEMNVELRHRLFWLLDGAIFADAGNVWTASNYYRFNNLAYSAGIGLRFKTPIGPIRLDVSRPIGNEKKRIQFFLSVGQAF